MHLTLLLIKGGSSKYVCIYDIAERIMLRRFQVRITVTSQRSITTDNAFVNISN